MIRFKIPFVGVLTLEEHRPFLRRKDLVVRRPYNGVSLVRNNAAADVLYVRARLVSQR